MDIMEPIDIVIPWVDGKDPEWINEKLRYTTMNYHNDAADNRYRDWGLLRYVFRSIEQYAPWIHRIYFITWGHYPKWLNTENPKLRIVSHEEYIPKEYLPTYNSNVIELFINRLPELSEKFILFNDDLFLTAPVKPEDFFENGLPKEIPIMQAIAPKNTSDIFAYALMNNAAIINQYFNKKEVMKKYYRKFLCLKYGKVCIRNLLLLPFKYFTGFRSAHLMTSYLKSTFDKVWELEEENLKWAMAYRFRSRKDITHWVMQAWQICEGNFSPRSMKWGHHYELGEDGIDTICNAIETHKYHAICLNDSTVNLDYAKIKETLIDSFNKILGTASSFEREE